MTTHTRRQCLRPRWLAFSCLSLFVVVPSAYCRAADTIPIRLSKRFGLKSWRFRAEEKETLGGSFATTEEHGDPEGSTTTERRSQESRHGALVTEALDVDRGTRPDEADESIHSSSGRSKRPKYDFPLVQRGDGHEEFPGVPRRYLRMQKGNIEKAKQAFALTLQWRKDRDIDTILSRPHPKYDVCKSLFPHFFAGRDIDGHVIFVQRPGLLDLDMASRSNVTNQDLLMHYAFVLEYCWNIMEPRPDQTMTSVLDLQKVTLGKTKGLLKFITEFVSMMSQHYPQRSFKTLVINSPGWFGAIFRLMSPLLRESTKAKIKILSGGNTQDNFIREILGNDTMRPELLSGGNGSEGKFPYVNFPMECELREFCLSRLNEANQTMQAVK